MSINTVHHANFLHNNLPDKCANLIIADPPYFEVKGSFDFIWKSFDDYLKDVELWAIECKRLLADNGTLFWFGDSKKIAYSQLVFDKYFHLVNNLTWEKAEADGLFGSTGSEQLRSFPNSTERILMYSNECFKDNFPQRDYIREEILKSKGEISFKAINTVLGTATNGGGVASACLSSKKAEPAMITEDMYKKLQAWCNPNMQKEYQELRRPFVNFTKSTEIIKVRFKPSEFAHDTVKPEKLARLLILTSSRENDLVLVPFSGSGTECAMSVKEGRNFIGYEIDKRYVDMANERCKTHIAQTKLFTPAQIKAEQTHLF